MPIELDQTDLQILQLLQQNARLTHKEIGEKLHKTATPIFKRIKRLENEGYIKRYVAVLDYSKLEKKTLAFASVAIKNHSSEGMTQFQESVAAFEEVLECYQVSGEYDFIVKVAVPDLQAYQHFLMNKLSAAAPLTSVQTTFVLKETKSLNDLPMV